MPDRNEMLSRILPSCELIRNLDLGQITFRRDMLLVQIQYTQTYIEISIKQNVFKGFSDKDRISTKGVRDFHVMICPLLTPVEECDV